MQPRLWDWEPGSTSSAETPASASAAPRVADAPPSPSRPAPVAAYLPRILRITDLNRRVRALLDDDAMLGDLWVEGEVSAPSLPPSGHCFFTLKDASSQIKAVMFREELQRSPVQPLHGMQVICHGRVRAYETQGVYQLYVESLQPAGRGDLHRRYEALRAKLTAEGLFAAENRRALPRWPRRIGVATSPVGAVWRDIGNILRRRFPLVEVVLSATIVQGDAAAAAIVRALQRLYADPTLDVIILARGGGSMEDLWSFNDERVVRCVAASPVPIVVGVGHESDVTLSDFAADVRAPTPSAAAELVVPDGTQLPAILGRLRDRAHAAARAAIDDRRRRLEAERRALARTEPNVPAARERAAELLDRGFRAAAGRVAAERGRLEQVAAGLRAVGPAATLARGYAIARREDGTVVRDPEQVRPGDALDVVVHAGTIGAQVRSTRHARPEELIG
ncbi:MAG: exodeoxyribonuclease VII large subunit [Candidatus Limnocylindria bacterium]